MPLLLPALSYERAGVFSKFFIKYHNNLKFSLPFPPTCFIIIVLDCVILVFHFDVFNFWIYC